LDISTGLLDSVVPITCQIFALAACVAEISLHLIPKPGIVGMLLVMPGGSANSKLTAGSLQSH